mgnify:CR=1 FL=1
MCLAVPMKIQKILWPRAEVSARGIIQDIDIQLVPKVEMGDYVLVHAGFAIQILDKEFARESLELWEGLTS